MSVTVDANVLVYASNVSDPAYARARGLAERLIAGPDLVYLLWPTLMGYLRIATHPGILPRPRSPAEVMGNISALLARPHVRAAGELEGFWALYRLTSADRARGNDVPDAHVVALMRQHGVGTIYTRDRDFRRYDGIRVEDPFA